MTHPVRIPADVDREDRVVANLTPRQLLILALTGIALYLAWTATQTLVPLPVFAVLAAPVAAIAAILVLGQRDGLSFDRLLVAALCQRTSPRRLINAPEGVRPPPTWLTARATHTPASRQTRGTDAAPLRLPARTVTPQAGIGVIELGADGLAVIAVASTVNFSLRTPGEQDGLVGVLARYLHSLTAPVQILVRAMPADLTAQIHDLDHAARQLPHPALARAAADHAEFLAQLTDEMQLLTRQVLIVLREPLVAAGPVDGLGGASPLAAARGRRAAARDARRAGDAVRRAAHTRLARRLAEATDLLAPAGIVVTPLDAGTATSVLAAACNPAGLVPPAALAAPDDVITADTQDPGPYNSAPYDPGLDEDNPPHDHALTEDPDYDDGWDGLLGPAESDDWDTPARQHPGRRRARRASAPRPADTAAAAFVPDALTIAPRHLDVGGDYLATMAITGYPREVHAGWLAPLLTYPGRVDVAVHIEPIDPVTAAHRLRRQLSKLESGRQVGDERGRLIDPQVEAATEDAYDLSARVARGEGKLFRFGLYLTVHASSERELADEVAAVRALAASLLLDAKPVSYRSLQGWVSTLPLGLDPVRMRRTFDTAALAAAFPFTSPDLPPTDPTSLAPTGVLYGLNVASNGLVHWDRFGDLDNHNSVILGRSGAGKSYLVKLEVLRSLYRGVEIHVVDPEDEYARLAAAVGATYLHLGADGVRINPFDLPIQVGPDGRRTAPRDALIRRSLFLHTAIAVMIGSLTAADRAVLDIAITATYQAAGISSDPRTWHRPAPLLADLTATLTAANNPAAQALADRLHPFAHGAFSRLFDGPTSTAGDGHLVVYSLRDLADELKPIGTLLVLDAVWRRVSNPAEQRRRLVVVDEAWLLMRQQAGADFLFRMAKSSRKHWAGLTVATQDTADVLATDLGRAIVTNAATQILLRQAPQAIDEITAVFDLSEGERQFLLSADRGQGLLAAGTQRVAFHALAAPAEHRLITTNPAELAADPDLAGDDAFLDLTGAVEPDDPYGEIDLDAL